MKIILFCLIGSLLSCNLCLSNIPPINRYKLEKLPIAIEPTPQQYSVSESDQMTLKQPAFSFHTELNCVKPSSLYLIAPFRETNQIPKIGQWMVALEIDQKQTIYVPAHWLDEPNAQGQLIIEPINYLFMVHANDGKAATKKLKIALMKAGFTSTWSGKKYHSDHYYAYIDNKRVTQLKRKNGVLLTFSNNYWLKQNDHFRVMGPYKTTIHHETVFLYVSSVSEETAWDQKLNVGHFFVSFGHARNNLAVALIEQNYPTYYAISKPENTLNTTKESTEDHDGKIFITIIKN